MSRPCRGRIFKLQTALNYAPPTGATKKCRTVKRRGKPPRYIMRPLQGQCKRTVSRGNDKRTASPVRAIEYRIGVYPYRFNAVLMSRPCRGRIFKLQTALNYAPPTGATKKCRTVKRRGKPPRYIMRPLQGQCKRTVSRGNDKRTASPVRAIEYRIGVYPYRFNAVLMSRPYRGRIFK